jgi:hypothetical protein
MQYQDKIFEQEKKKEALRDRHFVSQTFQQMLSAKERHFLFFFFEG